MKKTFAVRALDLCVVAALVVPGLFLFQPELAHADPNPSEILRQDRYAQREAERYEIFCEFDTACLADQLEARKQFLEIEKRARAPGKRWRKGVGLIGPDKAAVAKAGDVQRVLKFARTSSVVQIKDDYVVDYQSAFAMADKYLRDLGYFPADACWLTGREFAEQGYFECFDYGNLSYVFPNVDFTK